jgi:hypothetical protein
MSNAYYIKNSKPVAKGDALSCRHFERKHAPWDRAFFSHVREDGNLVVTFEGETKDMIIRPMDAYGVMVRR